MLKPTRAEITAQSGNLVGGLLATADQRDARALVRQLDDYSTLLYPDLDARLAAVSGYDAQQILAALARVEALDQDMDRIQVTGLLTSNENDDRTGWARYIRAVLFDGVEAPVVTATGVAASDAIATGPWCGCLASPCTCGRRLRGWL